MSRYSGSSFDNFLREEGILEEVSERDRKRLLTLQLQGTRVVSRDEEDMEMLNRVASEVVHASPHLNLDNTSITVESYKFCNGIETSNNQS